MNEVSYDAVEATKKELNDFGFMVCDHCDLGERCKKYEPFEMCGNILGSFKYFKKSTKSFEK